MSTRRRREHRDGGIDEYTTPTGKLMYRASWREPVDPDDPDSRRVRRFKRGFADKDAARDFLAEVRTRLRSGEPTTEPRVTGTLGAFLDDWVAGHRVAASTLAGYRKNIRLHITPHIGHYKLTQVTPAALARHYRRLESGELSPTGVKLGPNTVHKVHQVLSVALGAAQADGLIRSNPAKQPGAKPPTKNEIKRAKRKMVVWTRSQLDTFLSWAREHEHDAYFPAWVLVSHTGLRRSEACELRWGDVDLKTGLIHVSRAIVEIKNKGEKGYLDVKPTKNYEPRIVELDEQTIDTLKEHRTQLGKLGLNHLKADAPLFLTHRKPHQLRPDHMTRRWSEAVARFNETHQGAPVPVINLHALRHTHASHMFAAGYEAKEIQARLGHETITITSDLYTHLMPASAAEKMRRFSAYMRTTDDNDDEPPHE